MEAYIDGIKPKEGKGIELVVIVTTPLMPQRSTYSLKDEEAVDAYNADHEKALHDRKCFNILHLGGIEITQEEGQ